MKTEKCDDCLKRFPVEDLRIDDASILCEPCFREAFKQGALDAGIPLSVIEGKTKLTDHFSQEYIDWKATGIVKDPNSDGEGL